jgi:hypothetical protein
MANNFPVLIVTFARPEGLKKLLEVSYASGAREIYVAIDGPKNEVVAIQQVAIMKLIKDFETVKNLELKVWQRDKNLGAAVSVVTAVDWFFQNVSAGLIFEDDLIPSVDFFEFANSGLEKYEHNEEVWLISGSRMNPVIQNKITNDWSHYPMIWGWGTWKSRWSVMKSAFSSEDNFTNTHFFSPRTNFWKVGAIRAKSGMVDAWDMPLAYFQWRHSKFSVIPPVNLVTNVGFDSAATHTSGDHFPLNHPIMNLPRSFQFQEKPDALSARKYDRELERELFGIRWRHAFLNIYMKLIDRFRNQDKRLGPLESRLNNVCIPQ